ncbi:hypothetical protein ACHQM5_009841 [Ranunculus cassubicifolius]
MAALEHLLSHARRHCTTKLQSSLLCPHSSFIQSSKSPFLGFQRLLSSSPTPDPPIEDSPTSPQIPVIKPVSYAIKPKSEEPQEIQPQRELRGGGTGQRLPSAAASSKDWTREDFRYVKEGPASTITPVSYPVKVAPLPDDKVVDSNVEDEKKEGEREKLVTRTRRILRVEEEKVLPFPALIKVEKKKSKVILDLQEAIREVKANAKAKFDETIEAHVNLGVDPRRGDQMVRGAATLPHGTGKAIRIAVFAEGASAEEARDAGADIVGGDELIEEIKKGGGKLNFDKCIATPLYMPRLGKIARILGPRGLMPNPKLGSVTSDVAAAVRDAKRGRIDFKIDKTAIVHVGLGKVSFTEESLRENIGAFVNALLLAKPVGLKKTSKYAGYVNSFSLSSTMGPGFPVSIQSLSMAADHYNKLQLK